MEKKEIILENIFTRRSIRKYTKDPVSEESILTMLKAGMYAPSAVNKQPWHFIVLKDRSVFDEIIKLHPNAGMLTNARLAILVCGDEKLAHAIGYIPCDCSAATQNILLAAHAIGLGAVWVGIYPREERIKGLKSIFNLPEHIIPFSIISIGFPAEVKEIPERFKQERIHYGKW